MKYLDEKDGVFKDAHDDSFTWNGKEFEVEMDENVGRVFRLQAVCFWQIIRQAEF